MNFSMPLEVEDAATLADLLQEAWHAGQHRGFDEAYSPALEEGTRTGLKSAAAWLDAEIRDPALAKRLLEDFEVPTES